MVNDEVREQLAQIVRQHGQSIIEDPPRLQGLLKDVVGQHRREINVLIQALRVNVPGELMRASGPAELTANRLVDSLQQDTGLSKDSAQWAVETWGNALGLPISFGEAAAELSVPEPPPVSQSVAISEPARPQATIPAPPPMASNPPPSQPPPMAQQQWQPPQPYAHQQYVQKKSSTGILIAIIVVVVLLGGGALGWVLTRKSGDVVIHSTDSPTISPPATPTPPTDSGSTDNPTDSPSPSETSSSAPSPEESSGDDNAIGKLEDGVYQDGWGLFSFSPPAEWDFTPDKDDGSVLWANPDGSCALDLRLRSASGVSAPMIMKEAVERLKSSMHFKENRQEDFNLGGVAGRIVYGQIENSGPKDLAVIIAVNNQKEVQLTISAGNGQLADKAKPINAAFNTWKWK